MNLSGSLSAEAFRRHTSAGENARAGTAGENSSSRELAAPPCHERFRPQDRGEEAAQEQQRPSVRTHRREHSCRWRRARRGSSPDAEAQQWRCLRSASRWQFRRRRASRRARRCGGGQTRARGQAWPRPPRSQETLGRQAGWRRAIRSQNRFRLGRGERGEPATSVKAMPLWCRHSTSPAADARSLSPGSRARALCRPSSNSPRPVDPPARSHSTTTSAAGIQSLAATENLVHGLRQRPDAQAPSAPPAQARWHGPRRGAPGACGSSRRKNTASLSCSRRACSGRGRAASGPWPPAVQPRHPRHRQPW